MFRYYLALGFRSLRRNPVLTLLMVMTLSVGVAASMTTLTLLKGMSGDPCRSCMASRGARRTTTAARRWS